MNAVTIEQALETAVQHHQAGRLAEAESIYRQILAVEPGHADALHMMGVIAMQVGQHGTAVDLIAKAVVIKPDFPEAHNNLGNALHNQVDVAAAIAAYRRAIQIKPDYEGAYNNLGVALKDQGDITAAIAAYRRAIEIKPDYESAYNNLGNALKDQGDIAAAIAAYHRAIQIEPDYPEAHSNLGNALKDQGDIAAAIAAYRRTIQLKPDLADAHYNLGAALKDQGDFAAAIAAYHRAIQLKPDYPEAHTNLGNALKDQGDIAAAIAAYRRAIQIKSDYAQAHCNLGAALAQTGQLEEAIAATRRAIQIKPNDADALCNLAFLLNTQGDSISAFQVIKQSLRIKETAFAKRMFVDCVENLHWTYDESETRIAMVRALTEPWGRPSGLAACSIRLVKLDPCIATCVAGAARAWPRRMSGQDLFGSNGLASLAGDRLLCAVLTSTPVCDIDMERFLTMARHAMLEVAIGPADSGQEIGAVLNFFSALARQCFINEYVFSHTEDEIQKAADLRDSLVAALEAGTQVPVLWPVAIGAYFPLQSLPRAAQLLDGQWPEAVTSVLVQQIREPAEERQHRATIPRLTEIEDDVSRLVQNQYEENPYPRWVLAAPVLQSGNIDEYLVQRFPMTSFKRHGTSGRIDILIAGCGTGQHSIETARTFPEAQVLAVDLSMSSLGHAKRKTRELGITSIDYAQADLMQLGSLERRFDVIESAGTLQCLADPLAGLRILVSLLRPGGFMRLGLYSEVARQNIVEARAFITKQRYGATPNEIRRFRQDLMDLDESAGFFSLLGLRDFFTTSDCRDLVFHVQEHRMTLGYIGAFLGDYQLQFLGFDTNASILQAYRRRFPADRAATNLGQWEIFENEKPDTFLGMYQFWIQKMG